MRILLVEDNPQVTAYVRSLLAQHPDIQVLGEAAGIEDGYTLLCNTPADVWILDISLQDGNVFQLLELLEQAAVPQAGIIFLTAYGTTEFIIQALRKAALDFLLKPVDAVQLDAALDRARQLLPQRDIRQQLAQLSDFLYTQTPGSPRRGKIPVTMSKGRVLYLELDKILYFEGDANLTYVHTVDGAKIASMRNLGHYRKALQHVPNFQTVSKKYLVNTLQIKTFDPKEITITFENGKRIETSRRGRTTLMRYFRGSKDSC